MEIRDPVHGPIAITPQELKIIDSRAFQRLRHIKQLGFGELSFPGATHNRYIHSLGTMHLATIAFDSIFGADPSLSSEARTRFRQCLRLAALLHDVGHPPLSHAAEVQMPKLGELGLPFPVDDPQAPAGHEYLTLKIILDSSLTPLLARQFRDLGIEPEHIAAIISPEVRCDDAFYTAGSVSFRPILQQIVSSELDADRMDYLLRDSYYSGVSYGSFDRAWLLSHLTYHDMAPEGDDTDIHRYLALDSKAIYTFDDFLLSRFHMFTIVYYHHRSAIYNEMLRRCLIEDKEHILIPVDIETYLDVDDNWFWNKLRTSENEWARRIVQQNPYKMILEERLPKQVVNLDKTVKRLDADGIAYIITSSEHLISKYFLSHGKMVRVYPIYVRVKTSPKTSSYRELQKYSELYEKYQEGRIINRLYIPPEEESRVMDLLNTNE